MTFSLVAADLDARHWGVAVASKFLAVGAVVPWARAEVGAVATQALANVAYGAAGLHLLAGGADAAGVVRRLVDDDPGRRDRQLGVVDARGESATYTGEACLPWAGGRSGPGWAAQGNILAGPQVVDALADAFARAPGPLADRLVTALQAADAAGGDRRGRQSAAVIVRCRGGGYGGGDDTLVDLRVDDHPDPVPELRRLLGIQRLLFGRSPREAFLPLEGAVAAEVGRLLAAAGHPPQGDGLAAALERWAGVENLEERLDPDRRSIDPVVLEVLRGRPPA